MDYRGLVQSVRSTAYARTDNHGAVILASGAFVARGITEAEAWANAWDRLKHGAPVPTPRARKTTTTVRAGITAAQLATLVAGICNKAIPFDGHVCYEALLEIRELCEKHR